MKNPRTQIILQQIKNSNPANQEFPNQTQQPKNSNPNH